MTALIIFHGAFLWVTASLAVLALSWRRIREVLSEPPGEDVLTPCEQYERERAALGEQSEVRA